MAHHPPSTSSPSRLMSPTGAVAQLVERRLCKAEVGGSSPPGSTNHPEPHHPPPRTAPSEPRDGEVSMDAGVTFAALRRATPCVAPRRTGRGLPSTAPSQQNTARVASHILRARTRASLSLPHRPVRPCEAHEIAELCLTEGQVTKGARWMPWRLEPMKDVAWLR